MVQVKADLQGATAKSSAARTPAVRPLPRHLQVWRWRPAILGSILSRMSAITFAYFFHLAGGIRRLVFDSGKGLNPAWRT